MENPPLTPVKYKAGSHVAPSPASALQPLNLGNFPPNYPGA